MTQVIPRRGARQEPGLVTLVRGDVRELAAIQTAALLAVQVHAQVTGCVLPVPPRPGLDLVRDLAGDCVGRWTAWADVAAGAFEDCAGS